MCGIAAVFNFKSGRPTSRELLSRMAESLRHRGPEDEGFHFDQELGLAHRRLVVIDRQTGNQPLTNETGSIVLIFNGEIYNHSALRMTLVGKGHQFRSRSDAEVVLHLYEDRGADCVHELNGDFAFVIWDSEKRTLFAARDHLGVKPLCYAETPDGIAIASEEKALVHVPGVDDSVDVAAVHDYLLANMILSPRTMFSKIATLAPGHFLICDQRGIRKTQYWDVPLQEDPGAYESIAAKIEERIDTAVRERLVADVPVGLALSGGLDSSVIALKAAEASPKALSSFCVRYEANSKHFLSSPGAVVDSISSDDSDYARRLAETLGLSHRDFTIPTANLIADLDRIIWHRDRPLHTLTEVGHYHLARLAKPSATVLLSGEAGDEVFGGHYYWLAKRSEANWNYFPWVWRASAENPGFEHATTIYDMFEDLLHADLPGRVNARDRIQVEYNQWMASARTSDFANKLGYLFLKLYLPEFFAIEDRLGLASAVEVRVPLADRKLVELVAGYPSALKLGRRGEKALLRDGAGRGLPEFIRERKKSTFPIPFDTAAFYREASRVLRGSNLAIHAYIDAEKLRRFLAVTDAQPTSPRRHALFRLYSLERWHAIRRNPKTP